MRVLWARTLRCQPDQRYEAANCLKATSARSSARGFLDAAWKVMANQDAMQRLSGLIEELRLGADNDVEQFLAALTSGEWRDIVRQAEAARKRRQRILYRWLRIAGGLALAVAIIGAVAYGGPAGLDVVAQAIIGTYTPTVQPIQATAIPMPTQPVPVRSTPTAVPVPTAKPTTFPDSTKLIADGAVVVPAVDAERGKQQWLLGSDVQIGDAWTTAGVVGADEVTGGYFYTEAGNANVTWTLDVPLNAGAYQIFVPDTLLHSVGEQVYEILVDGAPVAAAAGSGRVIFSGTAAYPQAAADWLSLGIYRLAQRQTIAVRTSVGGRSAGAPFAAGPILVVALSDGQAGRINIARVNGVVASLLDDSRAVFYPIGAGAQPFAADLQGTVQTDPLAWNGSFRSLDLSGDKWQPGRIGRSIRVDWRPIGRLRAGRYELYARIPQLHASASARYDLVGDGQVLGNGQQNAVDQAALSGQWALVGTWILPQEAAVGVRMTIAVANNPAQCEIGIDATVLLRLPD